MLAFQLGWGHLQPALWRTLRHKPRPNAGKPPRKRAFPKWRPKPSSCVDAVINMVESLGSHVAEKSLTGDLRVAPAIVSHSVDAGLEIWSPVPDSEPGSSDAVGVVDLECSS
ncbi:hypothetical protein Nepgr_007825 [Nepenthes gracilis]|uniref:Uncharacterized protein n=1 Tax=Nepenthes gracilis TaxID=150966 RepID=A0AAD3XIT8_NEPGR|nr:hypothetical protein Nepgr_007825 [Nepenthes gracilis]